MAWAEIFSLTYYNLRLLYLDYFKHTETSLRKFIDLAYQVHTIEESDEKDGR